MSLSNPDMVIFNVPFFQPHFTAYNRKFGTDHSHIDLDLYKVSGT